MKKIIIAVAFVFVMMHAHAQTRIAVKAGPNFGTARVTLNTVKQNTSYKPGMGIAVQAKVPFDGPLHFSPSVGYNMRSFKTAYTNGRTVENTIHYLTLAPNLSLNFPAGTDRHFVIGFGPVLGITNFGREKITFNGSTTSRKMTFGYGDYGWFDLGLTGSIGIEFKRIFVEAAYYHGLSNINNRAEDDGINIQNRTFGINLGYYFR